MQKEKDQAVVAVARGSGDGGVECAFICFNGHGGGWLRHVLVVMVTFWACQRGDPSCCRLRRPETLILRGISPHGFPVVEVGGRIGGYTGWIRPPSSGNHRFLLLEVVRSSNTKPTNRAIFHTVPFFFFLTRSITLIAIIAKQIIDKIDDSKYRT